MIFLFGIKIIKINKPCIDFYWFEMPKNKKIRKFQLISLRNNKDVVFLKFLWVTGVV